MGIYHKIGVKSSVYEVMSALTTQLGLANWWTRDVGGSFVNGVSTIGEVISFEFGHGNAIEMTVQEISSKQVKWECVSGPMDWIGSQIDFQLDLGKATTGEEMTILYFRHHKWKQESEFTAHCSMKWATFLLSLKNFLETGIGRPSPDDLKIDDMN
ncbi:SRPBCC domain-containing protein [Leptospira levettii]|uniref:toxin n=2 Tax=Leptospira levettii TaxID=2023178 RepID=UPI000C29EF35|nr:toxin [Leptospira levettii]MCW7475445.1 SRPBCC domain-containing protein [Leptospira levettii]PJZ88728.1 toxin [Leptospira levettii]PJZ99673.1 toxin [Leptospira levettii]TGM75001.1 SRPBCC domain-containing protein [Leptospira levettii]